MRAVLVERLTYGAVGTDVLGLTGPALLSLLSTRQSPNARTASSARNRALSQRWPRRQASMSHHLLSSTSTRTRPLGDEV